MIIAILEILSQWTIKYQKSLYYAITIMLLIIIKSINYLFKQNKFVCQNRNK